MGIKVTVKRRIVYNGKAYDSPEELPENVRQAYAKAMADPAAASSSTPKVVFNGTEYDGLDAMPPEVRALYESALGAVGSGRPRDPSGADTASDPSWRPGPGRPAAVSVAPIEPGSANPRSLRAALVAALALALLLLGYYFYTTAAR
jgi:hypothetical protein